MTTAEDAARALGITTLRLDTNSTLFEAVGLYRAMGWAEIDRFNDDPYPDLFFERLFRARVAGLNRSYASGTQTYEFGPVVGPGHRPLRALCRQSLSKDRKQILG